MKKLTLLLLLVSGIGYGQTGSIKLQPSKSNSTTHIALLFNPTMCDSLPCTIYQIRKYQVLPNWPTESDFKNWYTTHQLVKDNPNIKYVEVRVKLEGVSTDYTFEEFKKLIWPD